MRIGIIVTTGPENGGTFFYSLSVLNAFRDFGHEHEVFVFYDNERFPVENYLSKKWTLVKYKKGDGIITKFFRLLSLTEFQGFRNISSGRHSLIKDYKIDLVICPSTTMAAYWCHLPYIVSVHDVYHRYSFPGNRVINEPFRDLQWRIASKYANIVLVESELGKKQLMDAYQIPEKKIRKLPTGPAAFIWNYEEEMQKSVQLKYQLPDNYVFYPGGFSPGKNQKCIIEAVAHLRNKNDLDIHVILAGPNNEYCEELKELSVKLNVVDLVHMVGLVPDGDMVYLYKTALALVMASFIGPTNMPIWEAFAAGCPVISSNAGEMSDQVGDAGILFNPSDHIQLADSIQRLLNEPALRDKLISLGYKKIEPVSPQNWAKNLLSVINEAF